MLWTPQEVLRMCCCAAGWTKQQKCAECVEERLLFACFCSVHRVNLCPKFASLRLLERALIRKTWPGLTGLVWQVCVNHFLPSKMLVKPNLPILVCSCLLLPCFLSLLTPTIMLSEPHPPPPPWRCHISMNWPKWFWPSAGLILPSDCVVAAHSHSLQMTTGCQFVKRSSVYHLFTWFFIFIPPPPPRCAVNRDYVHQATTKSHIMDSVNSLKTGSTSWSVIA